MAEYLIKDSTLTGIANAIREKTGGSDPIAVKDMETQIKSITGGGGGSADDRVKYVTFMYGATELIKYPVISGDTCRDPVTLGLINKPTKESTAQYTYEQNGWSLTDGGSASASALTNVTEDRTVYAAFKATEREYTITYLDSDGVTVLNTETVKYGKMPSSYTPEKEGAIFDGWTTEITAVTGDASYIAKWIEVIGGALGDNCTWVLDSDTGTLTISGTGVPPTYANMGTSYPNDYRNRPFHKYAGDITKVVVEEGITEISDFLLSNLRVATEILLPSTLTRIGGNAFNGNNALTSLTIPDGVTYVGTYFIQYTGITSIKLPSGLIEIGNYAFSGFYGTTITIPASVTLIGKYPIGSSTYTTKVIFEETSGWFRTTDKNATSGTAVDVTNSTNNASMLKNTTYKDYYWKRTVSE